MGTRKPINLTLLLFSIVSWTGVEPGISRSDTRFTDLFHRWKETHGKIYDDVVETGKRFENFKKNLRYVEERELDRVGFSVGLNRFADLSNVEFREMYFGKVKGPVRVGGPDWVRTGSTGLCDDVPLGVDWREVGVVTQVKDQGVCGSSWAFSAIGAIEGINAINTGELISLSEQALIDCDKTNNGCDGGYKEHAFDWFINNGGIYSQADYPYASVHGTCNANKVPNSLHVHGYEKLEESETALLCATVKKPISVGVHGSSLDFQLYTGGIYDGACSSNPDDIDHSVLIVGFGSEGDKDYWIVKNSWGTDWGMNGYMYIRRNTNLPYGVCAINAQASYPTQIFSAMSPFSAAPLPSPMSPPTPSISPPKPSPVSSPPPPSLSPPPPPPPPPYYPPSPPPPSSHRCGEYSYCNSGQTCCCLYEFSGYCLIHGCCDYIDGVCCSGTDYCCPRDYPICDPDEGICLKKSGDYLGVSARKKNLAKLNVLWGKPEEQMEITSRSLQWRKAAMR
ncbi:hypothetical protein vseg_007298 [Gypsophila vaccaria]